MVVAPDPYGAALAQGTAVIAQGFLRQQFFSACQLRLKPFGGTQGTMVFKFLDELDALALATASDQALKLEVVQFFLGDYPRSVFNALPAATRTNYRLVQDALEAHFQPPGHRRTVSDGIRAAKAKA